MRILVFASGKSGSTALVGSIQKALPDHELVFEPPTLENIDDEKRKLIVKSFGILRYVSEAHKFPCYDRRILLVRHPFDRLISALLYAPFNGIGFENDHNAHQYLDLIRAKVESPESVSIIRIGELFRELTGVDFVHIYSEQARCYRNFYDKYANDFLIFRYEDLIANNRGKLEEYLGFSLERSLSVPRGFERVSRNRKSGDWTQWFLESDREFLAFKWSDYFETFSSYSTDTPIISSPDISIDSSWGYVLRMINAFRSRANLSPCVY